LHFAILIHQHDDFDPSQYLLLLAVQVLRERGWRISIIRGLDYRLASELLASHDPPAACFVHVDLTVVPDAYLALAARFARTINASTRDISKRAISRHLVARDDAYDGPVIVKTNNNCGGLKEAQAARRTLASRAVHAVHRRLPWMLRRELPAKSYRVFGSKRDVPALVWLNPGLVVERFIAEVHDGDYVLRSWVFMGTCESVSIRKSRQPIVALPNVDSRAFVEPTRENLPDDLRAMRRELGFDFGKFDFVIREGRAVLFDANRTPTNRSMTFEERVREGTKLADGVESLVERRARAAAMSEGVAGGEGGLMRRLT
jgi:hypothetical protein